ncbi:hypothetical protein Tco_0968654 [Tanacetum coccineum]
MCGYYHLLRTIDVLMTVIRSGYQQKDRKPSQNDKTEHGMEKTVQNQGQKHKRAKVTFGKRQEDIRIPVPRPLVFFGPQRNPNEPSRYLYNKDLFFLKHGNTEEKKYILSLHKIHAEQFPEVDLEEKMNRWVRKEFKTFNEDAWITEVVRITTDQPHGLDFMEQIIMMRENDELDSFSEADFKI